MALRGGHLWKTVREYVTEWTVAGVLLAATGAAPEHWVAEIAHHLPWSHGDAPPWLSGIDYRLVAVIAGLTVVVGDTLWRNHRRPLSPSSLTLNPVPSDKSVSPSPDRASLAVLAFDNLSGDPEQEYFADGITEEIITGLSRVRWLFVIARNSSFTYKGKKIDVRQVARELGVRYVLEGSVRKWGDSVRITAQLIEAESGTHVWAERFEGVLSNVFALQDQVTDSIVRAIAPTLRLAEIGRARRKPPADMRAYDYYLRALPHWYSMTKEGNDEAVRLLGQAISSDADFAPALGLNALMLVYASAQGWTQPPTARHSELLRLAHAAAQSDPNDPEVLAAAAHSLVYGGREYDLAVELAQRARSLGPNSAFAFAQSGFALFHAGRVQEAVSSFEHAMQLDPVDPMGFSTMGGLTYALISLGEDARAVEAGTHAVQKNPNFTTAWRGLIAALALSGRQEEARQGLATLLRLEPSFTLSGLTARTPSSATAFKRIVEGLRLAGAPEQ